MSAHRLTRNLLLAGLCAIGAGALAATARVDDTGTSLESITRMYWRQLSPARKVDNTMEGIAQVQVRLNLAPWAGRSGRIFMVLPEQPMGPIRASWPAHGRFLAGELASGQRALVYAGPINSPIMEGLLVLKLEVDGTRLQSIQRLNFHFEIDVD
jgi:hypothetical protein